MDVTFQKEKLKKIGSYAILGYLKSMIDIIANNRANNIIERMITNGSVSVNEYEEMLIQAEANVRLLIKTQHQLGLQVDNMKGKIEELEKRKSDLKRENDELKEVEVIYLGAI